MDRGAQEREEAGKLKSAIARNGQKPKRHHRLRDNAHNPRDEVHREALDLVGQDTALLTMSLSPREPGMSLGSPITLPGVPSINWPSSCFVLSSEDEFMLDQIVSSHSSAGSLHSSTDRSGGAAMSPRSTISTSILSGLQSGTGTDLNLDLAGDH
ncbi:uncharacterized protein N7498_005147 [Penicillium cinerascens]|uniref:Uncharacterized protein n=1 Tax=Penicillium cinerascens TaxID=70096 RepID=A0A9W9MN07_9EURO|nr:uncharacterized protein N7498_005147 [Penicillium cinerascens]KAJ5204268.1 hypothetical protein N7498_005147 [Penicillium cinerascens]